MQVPARSFAEYSTFLLLFWASFPPFPSFLPRFQICVVATAFPPYLFFLREVGDRAVAENIGQFSRKEEEADRVGPRPSQSFTSTGKKTAHLTGHSFF